MRRAFTKNTRVNVKKLDGQIIYNAEKRIAILV